MTAHGRHILVVEDDADIRELVAMILEDQGYEVQVAEHGADALTKLRSVGEKPCLILLDLMMPIMDGWSFCEEKERDPSLSEIPVVVVSAVERSDARNASVRSAGHLPKPVDMTTLLQTVALHC